MLEKNDSREAKPPEAKKGVQDDTKTCSLSKDRFWHKVKTSEINFRDYIQALESIRGKGKNMNIIDERLFHALNIPLPLSYTNAKEGKEGKDYDAS